MSSEEIKKERKMIYSPLRLVGILTLIAFCTVIIITATFTRIKLLNCLQILEAILHPEFYPDTNSVFQLKPYFYVPQIPAIMFAATLLGTVCSLTSVFLFIVIGLTVLPVFGLGGGFDYVLNPTFGYLLAFIPGIILITGFTDKNYSFKSLFKATAISILSIHILGFLYMFFVSLIKKEDLSYIADWLLFESLIKIIFDLIFGFLAVIIAKYTRKFIWILTAR